MMKKTADILIVDNIEANREVLFDLITKLGHTPIPAENGLVALKKLKTQQIDLVLLDILVPKLDEDEVLIHIKQDVSWRHIPVIMTTAVDDTKTVVHYIEMGAEDYLIKPFNSILFNARINACLERKSLRDKEEEYLHQIEEANLRLEELLCEQTKKLTVANERLRLLNKAKGDALKYFHNSLRSLFKKVVKDRPDHADELLEMAQHSFELTKLEPSTIVFELNVVRTILQSAMTLVTDFAQSHQVSIGSMPDCGGQALTQNPLETTAVTKKCDEEHLSSAKTWQIVADGEQAVPQKELCANALAELIKTAVKFSRPSGTVTFSCEPLQKEVSIGIHATGRTIPEAELSHFFEVPSNIEKVTSDQRLGRGHATAKHIITLLGGSVTVANRDAAGISFLVKLKC